MTAYFSLIIETKMASLPIWVRNDLDGWFRGTAWTEEQINAEVPKEAYADQELRAALEAVGLTFSGIKRYHALLATHPEQVTT